MNWVLVAVATAVAVFLAARHRRTNAERLDVLEPLVGRKVRLVTLQGKVARSAMSGTLLAIDGTQVVLRWKRRDVAVPVAAIQEVWRGGRRLGRW